ncbi:MAG TPA: helix-turn-helix transcriptional regulator [Acetobacteraceae bacterium]|nr:helix-turn-helix transcriptional regulator [Acetobacteraceae bacterium]
MPDVRSPTPTLRRGELGAVLRARRLELGLTVEQVAEQLMCSASKISRMETGQRGATPRDVRDLCAFYGIADDRERARLMTLAVEGKQQGWWQPYALPYGEYVGLEQAATSMDVYNSAVVPGLLQTGAYAKALHEAALPKLDADVIEQRVETRTARQQLLDRTDPPLIRIVVDEAVLRRPIGGPAVMRDQLDQMIEIVERPNVTIQVLTFELGAHPALESNFTILKLGGRAPNIVYVEGLIPPAIYRRAKDVQRYQQVFERLREIGCGPQDSVGLIARIRDTYEELP